ncbi:MAG: molybdopterin synthase sulfur carrier subunit [Halioglobus sp.]|mgnify:CR=1 FL=1|nr:molybdopterin synthase sulfur carrier subunit [Halioglobus sp.]
MLKVLFFARVRETLDCAQLELPWSEQVARLDALQDSLCAQHGARWREVLEEDNMIRAVNQVVVQGDCALADGDEVAFFPPVTGG